MKDNKKLIMAFIGKAKNLRIENFILKGVCKLCKE